MVIRFQNKVNFSLFKKISQIMSIYIETCKSKIIDIVGDSKLIGLEFDSRKLVLCILKLTEGANVR